MTATSVPISAPNLVPTLSGFLPTVTGDATITITAGTCTDSSAHNYIFSSSTLTIDAAIAGAGGLDTGTLAASTLYAILVIDSSIALAQGLSNSTGVVQGMLTLASTETTPTLGTKIINGTLYGYDEFRVVGYALTDGSADFLPGVWSGTGIEREFQFAEQLAVLAAGAQTSFTTVDIDNAVPRQIIPDGARVGLNYAFTPASDSDTFALLTYGITSTNGMQIFSGPEASAVAQAVTWIPTGLNSGVPAIQYKVSAGTLGLNVFGYQVTL